MMCYLTGGSEVEGVGAMHTLYPKITTSPRRVEDVSEIEIDRPSVTLIKVHGMLVDTCLYHDHNCIDFDNRSIHDVYLVFPGTSWNISSTFLQGIVP